MRQHTRGGSIIPEEIRGLLVETEHIKKQKIKCESKRLESQDVILNL
jgi:hypothetical protein